MAVSYGFKRDSNGMESTPQRVVAYGGNGFFGRVIVDELLRSSTTQIEIASRTAHSVEYAGCRPLHRTTLLADTKCLPGACPAFVPPATHSPSALSPCAQPAQGASRSRLRVMTLLIHESEFCYRVEQRTLSSNHQF